MTLALASKSPIPLPRFQGPPPFVPETSGPPEGFALLLAARATKREGVGSRDPADGAAPVATAFDQAQLFGTAFKTVGTVKDDVPTISMTEGASLGSQPRPSVVASGATPSQHGPSTEYKWPEAENGLLAETSFPLPAPRATLNDSIGIVGASGSALPRIGASAQDITIIEKPALPAVRSAPVVLVSLTSKVPEEAKTSPMPRQPDASMRAARIDQLGPIYLSLHAEGAAKRIQARVAGVRNDEEDALSQSLRAVADAAGVEVETLFLNGTAHRVMKRS